MPDGRRRSREGWADSMENGPKDCHPHVHRLPRVVRLAVVGLVAAVFLLAVAFGMVTVQLYKVNQYVQGRGEFRDAEAARMEAENEERTRRAMCDLLDQLPEGGFLERPRQKYGCGPGIPIDQLTPDEQQRLQGAPRVAPTPPPAGVETSPEGFSFGADPNVERAEPYYPAPGVAEPPATVPYPEDFPPPDPAQPTGPPLVGPLVGQVCDLTRICIPEP